MQLIWEQGNDYIITVKANQKALHQQLQSIAATATVDVDRQTEQTRNRQTTRTVAVFAVPDAIKAVWAGAQTGVEVVRSGWRGSHCYNERHDYLSSLSATAAQLQTRIRGHWGIENGLHWVKDGVLKEDESSIQARPAATVMAMVRNLAITLFRRVGQTSITAAIDRFGNDLAQLLPMVDFVST
ncbi:MAG: ISAs1 family transposase [Leptolyngbyaceae cyanobacterium SM1_4_3]|nr:ISAs1 family transposase [Leptolyngbyaceae cyanobacterium SM1_4_3]